jgi:hypothetical protein
VTNAALWVTVLVTSIVSFALKFAGQSMPQQLLERPRVKRMSILMPIALLVALSAVLTFGFERSLVIDARAAGVLFAIVALLFRAPFLLVVIGAAATASVTRMLAG